MLRVHCTVEDLVRITVAPRPEPLLELSAAFAMLQRRDDGAFAGWRQRLAHRLPRQARLLAQLVSPRGAGPRFLDPPAADIDEGLDRIRSAPAATVRAELRRMSAIDRPITPWLRLLSDMDREAWRALEAAVRVGHDEIIGQDWPGIRRGFEAETAWRARVLAEQGVSAALATTCAPVWLRGTTLEAATPNDVEITLDGQGIVLQPTLFWTGHVMATRHHPDGPLLLIYPALTPFPLRDGPSGGDPLAAVMGGTRASALRALVHQRTTTDLARELQLSPAAASVQAKAMREAGLIVSQRDGKAIWHWCTPLGLSLLASTTEPAH
ncbi:MAG TPA: winged helix-turn-helix domain-containing protein [Pseudonocardiaceae bacterium]|nr:winged helix-turn-helix domain-containing protein [Pseudonocardiaceae bacterium]